MRGRPPKPVEEKRRTGNPGKRSLEAPVLVGGRVTVLDSEPEPPVWLGPYERRRFREEVASLSQAGILDLGDLPALTRMIEAEGEAIRAFVTLQREGHTVRGQRNETVRHPAWQIYRDASTLYLRYAEQFAQTPSARARLGLTIATGRSIEREMDLPAHPRRRRRRE